MAEMKITIEQLTNTAGKIRTINGTLKELLQNFSKSVTDLQNTWESDAGTHTKTAIDNLKPRFEDYYNVLASYAQHLDDTAESFKTNEGTLSKNADNMAAFS